MRKLIIALLFLVSCGEFIPQPDVFEANVKVNSILNENNIRNSYEVKATVFDNEGNLQKGTIIWIDFKKEIIENYGLSLAHPSYIMGVVLERTERDDTFVFLGWSKKTDKYKPLE